jgi:hypothetical protein
MNGENSMDFMHITADRIAKLIPSAQRRTFRGHTHRVEAGAVASVLVEFFKQGEEKQPENQRIKGH